MPRTWLSGVPAGADAAIPIFSGRSATVPRAPGAIDDRAAARTWPMPTTSSVTTPSAFDTTGPPSRLQWPMKSATKRVAGSP